MRCATTPTSTDAWCSSAAAHGRGAVQAVIAGLAGMPVVVSDADEAVATGAAVQAAAVLEQVDHAVIQERWGLGGGATVDGVDGGDIRERYASLARRDDVDAALDPRRRRRAPAPTRSGPPVASSPGSTTPTPAATRR